MFNYPVSISYPFLKKSARIMYLRSVPKKQGSEEGQDEKPNPISISTRSVRKKVTEGGPRADKKLQKTVLQIQNQDRLILLAQNQQMIKEAIMEAERAEQERNAKLANVAKFEWTAAASNSTNSNTTEFYTLTKNDQDEQLGPIQIQYLEAIAIPEKRNIETDWTPVVAAPRFEEPNLPEKCDP